MLAYNTGLAEVELPAEERMRVIALTEAALQKERARRDEADALVEQ